MKHLQSIYRKKITGVTTLLIGVIASGVAGGIAIPLTAHAAPCAPTGFIRDGINMTAAVIDPSSTVSGQVDATGCNIGVYFGPGHNGSVNNATIHGANYYGVVNQKAKVNVQNSNIYAIGESPLNGSQHGVGIYYATIAGVTNGDCTTGKTSGNITDNSVSTYQKGGIVASCTGTTVTISGNNVQGQGPVDYIAQNGIQAGYGADATVTNNIVTGNSYTGPNQAASGGILVVGGACYGGDYTTGTNISNNIVIENDVGVYLSNLDSSCTASTTKTNIDVRSNTISNASLNNTTGDGPTQGYQAGVSDQGDKDTISGNTITGAGYNPANSSASIAVFSIDTTATNHARVHFNWVR